jgi:hypothetical protein
MCGVRLAPSFYLRVALICICEDIYNIYILYIHRILVIISYICASGHHDTSSPERQGPTNHSLLSSSASKGPDPSEPPVPNEILEPLGRFPQEQVVAAPRMPGILLVRRLDIEEREVVAEGSVTQLVGPSNSLWRRLLGGRGL